ncbi:hypothetical protein FQ330_03700 [Agrococcus sediminis]|uniref:Asparagine synthetase domain-containing protein n=1 Tax=Agrococcus sediminis TaxID=2599924 RepID=A0A5M8QFS9_9MICO|nr:hypothetical protein [Agrococcus sediminis]KAA6434885.1 hypothetical protein FQ330_03700 [Agrococcus sediminis]
MLEALLGDRHERRQRQAMQAFRRREQQLRPAYKVWGYKNVFAKGFLVTRGPTAHTPVETWAHDAVGPWHVRVDPVLDRQVARGERAEVLVLGQAFDDGGPKTRDRVAERILRAVTAHPDSAAQTRALDETIAWLSGRYVVLVARGERLDAWGDPLATRSLYWHRSAAGVALASHSAILAELAGGLDSSRMRWVLEHPHYRSPAGRWLPGLITPHDEVGQLYANGRLTVEGSTVSNERFFPLADRVELSTADASARFRDDLRQQVRNWISVAPVTVLSLTAGRDSRAVLEAGLVDLQRAGALTLTYHPFHVASKSTYADFLTAGRLSAAAGLPHIGLDVPILKPTSEMSRLYRATFPTWQRYANLAGALYLHAPARAATIFGVGGAIVTGMWKDTSVRELTPQLLAAKYAASPFQHDPELHDELARWMDFTGFSDDALRGYDFYDFFHWEHRMTKWGGSGYSEYDLATIPAPVLSSRRLLTAALSLPKEQRVAAEVYRAISETGALAAR